MWDGSAILEPVILDRLSTRARATVAGCAVMVAIVLAACGSPSSTVTPSSGISASPSATSAPRPFTAAGFSTDIPTGWNDETSNQSAVAALSGNGTVLMLLVAPDAGHIDARTTPQPVPDDQLAQYLQSVSQDGATNLSQVTPVNVAGVSGVVITYDLISATGTTFRNQDMVVNQGGDTYDIVLNTAQADFTEDLQALQVVLNGWRWG